MVRSCGADAFVVASWVGWIKNLISGAEDGISGGGSLGATIGAGGWVSAGGLTGSSGCSGPIDFDHPKTYITSKQIKIKALNSKLKQVIK